MESPPESPQPAAENVPAVDAANSKQESETQPAPSERPKTDLPKSEAMSPSNHRKWLRNIREPSRPIRRQKTAGKSVASGYETSGNRLAQCHESAGTYQPK